MNGTGSPNSISASPERRNCFQKNIKTLLPCINVMELAETDLELISSSEISCDPRVYRRKNLSLEKLK